AAGTYDESGPDYGDETLLLPGDVVVFEGEIPESETESGFDFAIIDGDKYDKKYLPGTYETTVTVTEGKVAVGTYDESGADYSDETLLLPGDTLVLEGEIPEVESDSGFDFAIISAGKYAKKYLPGKYKTTVTVIEGKVAAGTYDESGADYSDETLLLPGDSLTLEGEIAGKYKTTVTVIEGKVAVGTYDEGGADYGAAKILTSGQTMTFY
ncbi:MAG: hypothetical protein KAS59_02010, partial [Alphaproteobacteria bacterium]|nr:hypothetical protein [Alphaproteobacteria bacterium]